jgi:predicted DNA-binding transcriptional regulator AlpA
MARDDSAKGPAEPTPPPAEEALLSMQQIAERLGKKEWFVRKLVRQGLPCIKLSERATWFVWTEVTQWLRMRSAVVKQFQKDTAGLHTDRWH